jgi:ABC-type glycerol-3-phosphate transport system substrate-binding protein
MHMIHRRQRRFFAVGGWLLLCVLLAGCRLPFMQPPPTPLPPVELEFVTFGGAWNRAEENVIEAFQTANPQVEFDRHVAFELLGGVLNATPPPDIVATVAGFGLSGAARQGQLLDLTDLGERAGLQATLPANLLALTSIEGEQALLPVSYPWNAVYYNRALFQDLGLTPPATWDEFIALCETLVINGITPLSIGGDGPLLAMLWFDYLNLRINGPDFHRSVLDGVVAFDDPRIVAVLEAWSLLIRNGYFPERQVRLSADEYESVLALVQGDGGQLSGNKAAMTLTNSVVLADLPPNLHGELGFFRFPMIDPALPTAEALILYGYVVPAQAEHPEAALDFLAYAVGPEAQAMMAQQMNTGTAVHAPVNPSLGRDALGEELRAGMDLIGEADALTPYLMASVPEAMIPAIARSLRAFLQEPEDVYGFALALEEAREQAVNQGAWGAR